MKITCFLILISVLSVFAGKTYSQMKMLNLNMENVSVKVVLSSIEDQSEFYFFFSDRIIDVNRNVSINAENQNIETVLKSLFSGTNVTYVVKDKIIVLTTPEVSQAESQQRAITGTVTDENDLPLPGVTVMVKGTTQGTLTNTDGKYSISNVPENATLVFSFVGMRTQEIAVNNQPIIDVTLHTDVQRIDEMVVVGYGTQRKVNLTGSVETIGIELLQSRALANVSEALQGAAANLNITATTLGGEPGAGKSINIRGLGTLTGSGGEPYVLVDGMPMNINFVNPDDIESVSVLKDAAASAIYGSRAPYGVILITTKKAKKGEAFTLNYSYNSALSKPTLLPEATNSLIFAKSFNHALQNAGAAPFFPQETLDRIKAYQEGTFKDECVPNDPPNQNRWGDALSCNANNDWMDLVFNKWALRQKHDLSISGGTNTISYNLSAGFLDQGGQMNWGDEFYKRYNLSGNITTHINDWISIDFITKYTRALTQYPNAWAGNDRTVLWHNLTRKWPVQPLYNPKGEILESTFAMLKYGGKALNETDDLWTKIGGEIEPFKGWKTNVSYSWNKYVNNYTRHDKSVYISAYVDGSLLNVGYPLTAFNEAFNNDNYHLFTIRTSYEKSLGGHNMFVMAGYEDEYKELRNLNGWKNNLVTDNIPSISTATGNSFIDDNRSHWATQGIFIRASYNYKEKYLLEVNARYDGSSRFENSETKWGFFPSASVGYNLSKESFMDNLKNSVSLDNLKIRASWGTLGNQNVANYLYIPILPVTSNLNWIKGSTRPVYTGAPALKSLTLTWETAETVNIGTDASFFKNRLDFTFDWYTRSTTNMFGPSEALPAVLGTSPPQKNNAEFKTTGFDMSISWRDKIGSDLNYSVKLNLGDNHSTIMKYNNPTNILSTWYEGKEYGEIWGYETEGFFQEGEDVSKHADQSLFYSRWQAGDIKYKDLNRDGKITRGTGTLNDPGDQKVIGNSSPRYNFGIIANANYKGFDVSMFWQGVGKRDILFGSGVNVFWGWTSDKWQMSGYKPHENYWSPSGSDFGGGPDAYFAKPYMSGETNKNQQAQTKFLQNAAYLRLKNLQLGYTIPENLTKTLRIQKARIYVSGENLLTITNLFETFDPETIDGPWGPGKSYPLSKLLSVGLNITF